MEQSCNLQLFHCLRFIVRPLEMHLHMCLALFEESFHMMYCCFSAFKIIYFLHTTMVQDLTLALSLL